MDAKKIMLNWTGERFLPWMEVGEIHYEHLHRYYFAKEFSKNKSVLDLACGEGYGSFILADTASKVVGIDNNSDTINHAKNSYLKNNLIFLDGDITAVPIKDKKFDLIVCFEALEHIELQDSLLSEINRLLDPNGILIISTPNKDFFTDDERSPFHKKELIYNEFKDLLENYFSNVSILGQNLTLDSNIRSESNLKIKEYVIERKNERYDQGKKTTKESKFFIGIASKKSIDIEIQSSFLVDKNNEVFTKKEEYLKRINLIINSKDTEIGQLDGLVKQKDTEIGQLDGLVKQKDTEIGQLDGLVKQKDTEIGQLDGLVKQ
ncbi:MAG: class I SAM-dependent methyltransferase, partial [Nitrosopumilus sp.]|nr:class I SAM-dependent methyltransferase [Nitrosopumilus sp.]